MYRLLSVAVLGFAGLSLAPQASQAQAVAAQVQVGPVGVTYQPGYSYVPPAYVVPAPVYAGPTVVVAPRVVYPWRWDGYRWVRHERFEHYRHYGYYRR